MARYDPDKHHRRSIRLRSWDYRAAGAYFVTLMTHGHEPLFGEIVDHTMHFSPFGEIVREEWLASEAIRREIELDASVVMPNHLHGIVWIVGAQTDVARPPDASNAEISGGILSPSQPALIQRPPRSLGSFVAGFKSACTRRINALRDTPGAPVWLRNYYERVIRNERELNAIRTYIRDNPAHWERDRERPDLWL
jgi:putative transposase